MAYRHLAEKLKACTSVVSASGICIKPSIRLRQSGKVNGGLCDAKRTKRLIHRGRECVYLEVRIGCNIAHPPFAVQVGERA